MEEKMFGSTEELSNTDMLMGLDDAPMTTEVSLQIDGSDTAQSEKKTKSPKMDRSGHKYSEEDFLNMPRSEQFKLASKYWMDSKGFDESKMFQFSYTHFSDLCKDLGFVKGVVDTSTTEPSLCSEEKIYIDRGRRGETVNRKMTISKITDDKINALLGESLSNIDKSKVIDMILSDKLDSLLEAKSSGMFSVSYRPAEEERLI